MARTSAAPAAPVENPPETTGGATGNGFQAGRSGNPGGRPKGLAKAVRDLVGADGLVLAQIMAEIATDARANRSDRMKAVEWLADRGWGKAVTFVPIEEGDDPLELSERQAEEIAAQFDARVIQIASRRPAAPAKPRRARKTA